jgi:hypothetical protein
VLKNEIPPYVLLLVAFLAVLASPAPSACAYVDFHDGVYTLSTPATHNRPPDKLPAEVGEVIVERLINPAHMIVTGLGEMGNATLRVGDSTKAEFLAALGPAKALPYGLKNMRNFGYISTRPGDNTVVVIGMGDSVLDNPDYVVSLHVCFSPAVLPQKFRPALKNFAPTRGVHADLATQSGIRLGMTRDEVEAVLGKPLWKEKDSYSYGVVADMILPAKLLITRWGWSQDVQSKAGGIEHRIEVWFVGGRVSAFYICKLYDM